MSEKTKKGGIMSDTLKDKVFKDWAYEDIEVLEWGGLPVRIYYFSRPEFQLLEFYIVELHGAHIPDDKESWEIEKWDIEHSDVVVIGEGYFSHKGFTVKIETDYTTDCKTFETIFTRLQQIDKK